MKRTPLPLPPLLGGVVVVVLSCGDPSPLGVGSPGLGPQAQLIDSTLIIVDSVAQSAAGLLRCSALPYDSVTQEMGPAGGVLQVGPHTLSVPLGALSTPVSITAVAPPDSVNRVQLRPEGLTFEEPADLTLSYANCDVVDSPKRIAYTSDALQILEYLVSVDSTQSQRVTGRLPHFSGYAVAW